MGAFGRIRVVDGDRAGTVHDLRQGHALRHGGCLRRPADGNDPQRTHVLREPEDSEILESA